MMLLSEIYFLRLTLEKVAAKKRVQDLFIARDAVKAALTPVPSYVIPHSPTWTCHICGLGRFYCPHEDCCGEYYDNYYYRHCPSCGAWLEDVEMD